MYIALFADSYPTAYVELSMWLETDFLGYLEQWEQAVKCRDGFTPCEKKTMLLSVETAAALKLIVMYNVMYVLYVLVLYMVCCLLCSHRAGKIYAVTSRSTTTTYWADHARPFREIFRSTKTAKPCK